MTPRLMPKAVPLLLSLTFLSQAVQARDPLHTAINGPCQLAFDGAGNLYVHEEYGQRVRRIDWKRRVVEVVAGNGKKCCFKEDAPAPRVSIYNVYSLAVGPQGDLYLGGRSRQAGAFVRVVDPSSGRIRSLAKGRSLVTDDGVPALDANLSDPLGMAVFRRGLLSVSASRFDEIVELGENAVTFAGNRRKGFAGDGGSALDASFDWPASLALATAGYLFVADYHNHRVRRIDLRTREITTVAGNGGKISSGDGGPATRAGVRFPFDIAVDAQGNLFVIENGADTVRRVDAKTGMISRFAGTGQEGSSGDGGPATRAQVDACGIALDPAGNLYIADRVHNRIRRVGAQSGIITTVAGNGRPKRKAVIE